jgi:hypothetical protein
MRAILLILILAVAALLVALATGYLDITQTRSATAPQIAASGNGVKARAGQTPTFDIETGSVSVGTKQKTVPVPTVNVNPPNQAANQQAGNATANGG